MEMMNQEQLILPSVTLTISQVPRPSPYVDFQNHTKLPKNHKPKQKTQTKSQTQTTANQALCHVMWNFENKYSSSLPKIIDTLLP